MGLTILAVIADYDVRALGAVPGDYNVSTVPSFYIEIDLAFADYLQEVVWSVVSQEPFSSESVPFQASVVRSSVNSSEKTFSFKAYLGYDYTLLDSDDLKDWDVVISINRETAKHGSSPLKLLSDSSVFIVGDGWNHSHCPQHAC